ncbi:MAG: SET domain-containing protein [Dokdonella sp.]
MILPQYHIGPSLIAGAGQGLFLDEPLARGRLITAPDAIPRVYTFEDILGLPDADKLLPATVRWFEDRYTVTPEWPDECYINHAFAPSALWHLGFVFAASDLVPGTEITVDYRHLLAPGQEEDFRDSISGDPITGFTWKESLRASTTALAALLA